MLEKLKSGSKLKLNNERFSIDSVCTHAWYAEGVDWVHPGYALSHRLYPGFHPRAGFRG